MAYENKLVLNLLQTNWLLPTPNKPLLKLQLLRNQIERVYPVNPFWYLLHWHLLSHLPILRTLKPPKFEELRQ